MAKTKIFYFAVDIGRFVGIIKGKIPAICASEAKILTEVNVR